jgi:hypothetical protein
MYKLYYTNHPDGTAHGGAPILVKETIEHYELLKYEEDFIQATSIKVKGFPYEIKHHSRLLSTPTQSKKRNILRHSFKR